PPLHPGGVQGNRQPDEESTPISRYQSPARTAVYRQIVRSTGRLKRDQRPGRALASFVRMVGCAWMETNDETQIDTHVSDRSGDRLDADPQPAGLRWPRSGGSTRAGDSHVI